MATLLKNIDAFCARLNAGLAAVAVVLTILVAAQLTIRMPQLYQQAIATDNATAAGASTASNSGR